MEALKNGLYKLDVHPTDSTSLQQSSLEALAAVFANKALVFLLSVSNN